MLRYDIGMLQGPCLAFVCAHLTDERLYAAQVAALEADYECAVFAFRDHDSLGAMAEELLANTPTRFTLIGLSLGGYLAFEIIRRQLHRLERLVLIDTTAVADHPERRAGRHADITKVREGGIEALIPELPARWLHPSHVQRADLTTLMSDMACSIGARGQFNQQTAMMGRPDSHDDLARVTVPTLVMCGRNDPVTPVADHEAIAAKIPGARLEIIENCGHLSTIEQPDSVNRVLIDWLRKTDTHSVANRAR
ncbi:MAG: alpha/beta hydrolase [Gammaproteobacteria bacterium]|nr:alpha/beta hydrolase [Gammaproteobacteria bacterium]MDH3411751.1 alpha/beta hydrolase [Gammaproteobacteria bacterium]